VNPPGVRASLLEIAAWVCAGLSKQNIHPVLVGGSAVSAHTANRYQSLDVDLATVADVGMIGEIMRELGFRKTGRVWAHPRFKPTVDFVQGPPAVGRMVLTGFQVKKTKYGPVSVTTPTQSVMDRLAAFYHWNDRQSLEQALLIARNTPVGLRQIAAWSKAEGMADKHVIFRRNLAASPKRAHT